MRRVLCFLVMSYLVLTSCGHPAPFDSGPLIAPPTDWPNVRSTWNGTSPINVRVGETFLIQFNMQENDMFPTFEADFDKEAVVLLGTTATTLLQAPYYTGWLCFQALKAGSTQITAKHVTWHFATNPAEPNLLETKIIKVTIIPFA